MYVCNVMRGVLRYAMIRYAMRVCLCYVCMYVALCVCMYAMYVCTLCMCVYVYKRMCIWHGVFLCMIVVCVWYARFCYVCMLGYGCMSGCYATLCMYVCSVMYCMFYYVCLLMPRTRVMLCTDVLCVRMHVTYLCMYVIY